MSKLAVKHPDSKMKTGAYSAGVDIDGWVWVSGQGPINLATGEISSGTIEEQTRITLGNVETILKAAGCGLRDIVKCNVHLVDIGDFDAFNAAYADYFKDAHPLPARTTVQSVLWSTIRIEIDAVARKPQ